MSGELHRLLVASLSSSDVDESVKERLREMQACSQPDTWWMFVASVSDDDPAPLQQARTLILCEYLLKQEKTGCLFGVNATSRGSPGVLHNPDQDEDGRATERTAFIGKDARLGLADLRQALEENKRWCRFIKVVSEAEPDVYISLEPFCVKNLLLDVPVPSILFGNIHVSVH